MRSCQVLGDMDGLTQNLFFYPGLKRSRCPQIHFATKQFFEFLLQFDKKKQPDWLAEFDKYVDIAVWPRFVSGYRSEQSQGCDMVMFCQYLVFFSQQTYCIISFHLGYPCSTQA